jgi:hypothetical protein
MEVVMSIKTQKFGGLNISVSGFKDGQNRVRDIDLGEWLELKKPRGIRNEIKKLLDDGILNDKNLNDFNVVPVEADIEVGSSGGHKTVTEYWLTEEAALFVVARSNQPKGVLALKALIIVFSEFRKANKNASRLLELIFRDTPIPNHEKRLFRPLAIQLSKFMDNEWDGIGKPPIWIMSIASLIYRWAFPVDGEQLKRRSLNVSPGGTSVDYDWLTDAGEQSLIDVLNVCEILASASQSYLQWRGLMENRYEEKALQLEFLVKRRKLTTDI